MQSDALERDRKRVESIAAELGLALTRIGSVTSGEPGLVSVCDASGKIMRITRKGFDHFGS